MTAHSKEDRVKEYAQCKDTKTKENMLMRMRNIGNHLHNIKVLKQGQGTLIVVHRPSEQTHPDAHRDYVPCPDCYGYFRKSLLYRHECHNSKREAKVKANDRVRNGQCLLPGQPEQREFAKFLLSFRCDAVSRVAKSDTLIMKFAERKFEKNGHDSDMHNCIRSEVRKVAQVLIELRGILHDDNLSLTECIAPEKFDDVVDATKRMCGYDDISQLYEKPSLAKEIGRCMKKCALLHKSESLQNGDEYQEQKATKFVQLMELTWNQRVSHHALRTLAKKRMNAPCLLPVTSDVLTLSSYLDDRVKNCIENLESDVGSASSVIASWRELCSSALSQIIMFNRRRQGEVSKMKLSEFTRRRQHHHDDDVVEHGLSKFEKTLCKSLQRIEITGKRGRTVPVLRTQSMEKSLSTLVVYRDKAGINPQNLFLFARANYSLGHVRGCDSLRDAAEESGVLHPETLRSTKLRKQIGTISQVINLKHHELDILADFMGHDLSIHRKYYRLPEQTFQAAKISKLLLALENGQMSSFAGKTLDDINISAAYAG